MHCFAGVPTTPATGPSALPKAKAARTTFNAHARQVLAAAVASRLPLWKAARGEAAKKVVEDEVWALAQGDAACEADRWGEKAVANLFHNSS